MRTAVARFALATGCAVAATATGVLPPTPAAAQEAADRADAVTPSGSRLQIAPGGVGFDELLGQLDRLREALGRLGGPAQRATDGLALIVHDDFSIDASERIAGNLALLDGRLRVGGTVEGDVLVLDGDLLLADGARIEGDILQVGGDVDLGGATVDGEIIADFPVDERAPEASADERRREREAREVSRRDERRSTRSGPFQRFGRNVARATDDFMGALTTFVALGVIGLLLVYFARGRVEMVSDTVRHDFARSFAMGMAAEVLFFPALLILCVLVITWPIVPFFVLGTGLAMLAGYLAVAHGAGEMFAQRRYRYEWLERMRRSNSYYYVLSGLVLLLLPFAGAALLWILGGSAGFVRGALVFLATVATWVLLTAGFGSVLLTRAGSRSVVVKWTEGSGAAAEPPLDEPDDSSAGPGDARPDTDA